MKGLPLYRCPVVTELMAGLKMEGIVKWRDLKFWGPLYWHWF